MKPGGASQSRSRRAQWVSLGMTLVALGLAIACTAQTRYEVLSFFFDGVPQPGGSAAPTPSVAGLMTEPSATGDSPLDVSLNWASVHPPYMDQQCNLCHSSELTEVLVATDQSLCLRCHGDEVIEQNWDHGPAEMGQCRICHEAHVSVYPNLQVAEQPLLCVSCHAEPTLMERIDAHQGHANRACTSCHDPHRRSVTVIAASGGRGN